MTRADQAFAKETDLCAAFLTCVPKGWTPYPETAGWDIVIVHNETGVQVGVEAKLVLNTKVLVQATEDMHSRWRCDTGPDFRAVLVGRHVTECAQIAGFMGIKVLQVGPRPSWMPKTGANWCVNGKRRDDWLPDIREISPHGWAGECDWIDHAPARRLQLPDYVPRVIAGDSAPRKLSPWTVQAIRLCVLIGRIGTVTPAHFRALRLSPSRWTDGVWLAKAQRGHWKPGPRFPGPRFQAEHPEVWAEVEADWPRWGEPIVAANPVQEALI